MIKLTWNFSKVIKSNTFYKILTTLKKKTKNAEKSSSASEWTTWWWPWPLTPWPIKLSGRTSVLWSRLKFCDRRTDRQYTICLPDLNKLVHKKEKMSVRSFWKVVYIYNDITISSSNSTKIYKYSKHKRNLHHIYFD